MMRAGAIMLGAVLALLPATAAADPLLAPVFQDKAILQRDTAVPVWGRAKPGARVTIEFDQAKVTTVAGTDGTWRVVLPAHAAGGPFALRATSSDGTTQALADILVGDVFLCSGQSNMAYPLKAIILPQPDLDRPDDPALRLLQVSKAGAVSPAAALPSGDHWAVAGPATVTNFSAVCLLAGRELRATKGVPIGLINASVGGSPIEDWMSRDALASTGLHAADLALIGAYARDRAQGQRDYAKLVDAWWAQRKTSPQPGWSAPGLDDTAWAPVTLTGKWQAAGVPALHEFNGTLWLRQTVTVQPAQATGAARIQLGKLGEMDATYVNGTWVGGDEGDTERDYRIPAGVLHAGTNVIAIRLTGSYGTGAATPPAGGARIDTPAGAVAISPQWRYRIVAPLAETGTPPHAPWSPGRGTTSLFNAMIAPLQPYAIKAVIWYQGEQNASAAGDYTRYLPTMMSDWRRGFAQNLPFVIVQLPNWHAYSPVPMRSGWAELREAQRRTVAVDANSALVVTIELGEVNDVHPRDKRTVAQRVVGQLRRLAYREAGQATSPTPLRASASGNAIDIDFAGADGGLVVYGGAHPTGFELCDANRKCSFVDARVVGSRVTIDIPPGASPSYVRYAWADSPIVTLFNRAALPATPFELPVAAPSPH